MHFVGGDADDGAVEGVEAFDFLVVLACVAEDVEVEAVEVGYGGEEGAGDVAEGVEVTAVGG